MHTLVQFPFQSHRIEIVSFNEEKRLILCIELIEVYPKNLVKLIRILRVKNTEFLTVKTGDTLYIIDQLFLRN
jgi:hypothetical protein